MSKVTSITKTSDEGSGKGLDYISDIVADIKAGKMVVMMDDEGRENEGDLIMAASLVRPEDINFMARYGRGLICLTLTAERCRQLRLPPMVAQEEDMHRTAFTVSIEAAEGVTTGISAFDRAHTIRTAVRPDAKPTDLVQPGHIFPVRAVPGGVLVRAGHTEAGCDLTAMAGLTPSAVICEILNPDGTMARLPDLVEFARQHNLKIGTIADLIRYRLDNEHSIERVAETRIQTEFGEFHLLTYQDAVDSTVHIALVKGQVDPDKPTLVRVHLRNTLADMIGAESEHFGWPLKRAMKRVAEEGSGVIVVLRKSEASRDLVQQIINLNRSQPMTQDDHASDPKVLRTYGIGAQILYDLGVRRMRVLSLPKRLHGISGFGLEVVEYVPCD